MRSCLISVLLKIALFEHCRCWACAKSVLIKSPPASLILMLLPQRKGRRWVQRWEVTRARGQVCKRRRPGRDGLVLG